MAEILYGKPVADALAADLLQRAEALSAAGKKPTLAIVRVGENGDDIRYESSIEKRCSLCGITVIKKIMPRNCLQIDLERVIRQVNGDDSIHGCLLLRPLPKSMDERYVCNLLDPRKDVDSITDSSLVMLFTGSGYGFAPCTAQAVIEILDYYGYNIAGSDAAVIGRSLVIGKPVSMMLQSRNATVTMCHRKTADPAEKCRRADILIAAAGMPHVITAEYTNPDQIIIDVGINVGADGSVTGDADFETLRDKVRAISPVPGGVGSVTSAVLCKHVIEAAETA